MNPTSRFTFVLVRGRMLRNAGSQRNKRCAAERWPGIGRLVGNWQARQGNCKRGKRQFLLNCRPPPSRWCRLPPTLEYNGHVLKYLHQVPRYWYVRKRCAKLHQTSTWRPEGKWLPGCVLLLLGTTTHLSMVVSAKGAHNWAVKVERSHHW
jgi:hypothetical protein